MKRGIQNLKDITKDVTIIMLDIEGTTTSISFVKEELFPYVRREVKNYLEATWDTEETQKDVTALIQQLEEDGAAGIPGVVEGVPKDMRDPKSARDSKTLVPLLVAGVTGLMDADRKVGALKTLQGHMWCRAYEEGDIRGHVYDDVEGSLATWTEEGKQLVVYSSGSVEAQKLLFGHSCKGDLLHYFSEHFDTGVGSKVESESYRSILRHLKSPPPSSVLFVTDLAKEAWAASEAGLKVVLSVREGTAPLTPKDLAAFPTITSFSALLSASSAASSVKRVKGEEAKGGEEKMKDGGKK